MKLSMLKFAKNIPDVAVTVLEVYNMVLAVKYFTVDSVLKVVKTYRSRPTAEKLLAAPQRALANKDKTENKNENKPENKNIKETKSMKKSTAFALFAFFAAAAAALVAAAAYLKKKEENLKDYEDMLYSDDYLADYMPKDEGCCCEDEGCECADEDCGDDDCCCDENPQE